ncbi:MAG: hypothetical protein JRJ19_07005 [Deltaproteobacteria bacterium]|nr:hypothetical protein [Deltaproteobacteria bacterium]
MRYFATRYLLAFVSLFSLTSCGASSSVPHQPCNYAEECAPVGDAICIDEACQIFSELDGYGNAVINISFDRDMIEISKSGYVRIIHKQQADGRILGCADIIAGNVDLDDKTINTLQASPKYLVFNCCGDFFPNILIQLIRPANDVIAVVQGYEYMDGGGNLNAIGCLDQGLNIIANQNIEDVTITVDIP